MFFSKLSTHKVLWIFQTFLLHQQGRPIKVWTNHLKRGKKVQRKILSNTCSTRVSMIGNLADKSNWSSTKKEHLRKAIRITNSKINKGNPTNQRSSRVLWKIFIKGSITAALHHVCNISIHFYPNKLKLVQKCSQLKENKIKHKYAIETICITFFLNQKFSTNSAPENSVDTSKLLINFNKHSNSKLSN